MKPHYFNGIRIRLILSYFTILLITIVVFEGTLIFAVPQYYRSSVEQYALDKVKDTAENFQTEMYTYYPYESALRELVANMKKDTKGKIQIVNPDGQVINDSTGIISYPVSDASDISMAIKEGTGKTYYTHPETGEALLLVSQKIFFDGDYKILRLIISVEAVNALIDKGIIAIIGFGAGLLLLTLILSIYISKSITKPVAALKNSTLQIAGGNYKYRVKKYANDELGELADAINNMAGELDKTDEMRSDFIALVSHELRTPLTAIKGWAETLELMVSEISDDPDIKTGLSIIKSENERLVNMVEELLDFSKLISERMELKIHNVNIGNIMRQISKQFAYRAKEACIELVTDIPEENIILEADDKRLIQCIIVLVDNAIKFTPSGGRVDISLKRSGQNMAICVADNGEGISPKDLPHITKKFYKGSSASSGTGIGLSVCEQIVILHGGTLDIKSELGKGTTITICLKGNIGDKNEDNNN